MDPLQDEYYMIDNQLDSRQPIIPFGFGGYFLHHGNRDHHGSQAHRDRDHDHHGSQVPQDQGHDPQDRHHVRHDGEIVKIGTQMCIYFRVLIIY